ncbi:DUF4251 domain-containing protein [Mucilaginibacter aquatilis]|uniref:DUF4251 domain-containing protein n=1 Tax=Mucilaginibacter aquatilis TaxID=1517760 RepID=A0A6I4IIG4_9SPHI|nr:DUF4251 domain-containing protein [Mucilaginibacter aquatilis]MVN93089.1 DUF4251 domain-containing protein [Mucilaginibacter aquatilis]
MKTLKYLIFFTVALGFAFTSEAQDSDSTKKAKHVHKDMKAEEVKQLLDSKSFVFKAEYANPLGGPYTTLNGRMFNLSPDGTGHIYLNYNYDVRIKPDSVIAFLPYFGRATMAVPYGTNSDNGVQFTSTKFEYGSKVGKKGNTTITINPKDARYTNRMILDVTTSGRATLQVLSNNKNSISYDGYIAEK